MKVLIIEDNPLNMKLASTVMAQAGYEVLKAQDAMAGIDLARQQQPHLILMDIQMPGMDGMAATKILKSDEQTRHIKVIALTAFAMKGDKERILASGCDYYVSKPFGYKDLLKAVDAVMTEKI